MTNPLLPPLPDAALYSEIMGKALDEQSTSLALDWAMFSGSGDIFIFCVAIGLAGGISVVGYTNAPMLPITHRVILLAAGSAFVIAVLHPAVQFSPLTMALIAACGFLSLVLEVIHRVRSIEAYAHVRLDGHR